MGNSIDMNKMFNTVINNQRRIIVLEKTIEKLINSGNINQSDFNKYQEQARSEIKDHWSEIDLK